MGQLNKFCLFLCLLLPALAWSDALRVLHLGDSHSLGSFGKTLIKLNLEEQHFDFVLNGSCGSSPRWWLKGINSSCGTIIYQSPELEAKISPTGPTPMIVDLINQHHPQIIIVELGSNLMPDLKALPMDASIEEAQFAKDTIAFIDIIHQAQIPCIWVGPPQGRNKPQDQLERLYSFLSEQVANTCLFVDSRPLTPYPATGGDGAHFDSLGENGRQIAKNWATYVWDQVIDLARALANDLGPTPRTTWPHP